MKSLLLVLWLIHLNFFSFAVEARSLLLSEDHTGAIGEYLQYMQESDEVLALNDVLDAYHNNQFSSSYRSFLSFGIGAQPVWLRFQVNNLDTSSQLRRLSIRTSWLDRIEIYFLKEQKLINKLETGDKFSHQNRSIPSKYFEFDHEYTSGVTQVYIRVVSDDPMVLPVYLKEISDATIDNTLETYSYGFIYGILFALLSYNLLAFFTLQSKRYLYYSFYITAFVAMNMSYTGHGFYWFWPELVQWQQWGNPLFMMLYAISGLMFATIFLKTRRHLPVIHSAVIITCLFAASAELLFIAFDSQVGALILSFLFIFVFSVVMVLLGALSYFNGYKSARYFLLASVTHVTMSSVTAMTVWGLVPYSTLGYRAIEFGMVFDAIILSIALVDQYRIISEEKIHAEQLAMTDELTNVNNRRAFYELVNPIWSNSLRRHREVCVLLMDVDKFKLINDTLGHSFGDKVLKKIASNIQEKARAGDIFARWGGEEFILFLPETTLAEALEIAERFRESVASIELNTIKEEISISVSIGVAYSAVANGTLDNLIMEADTFLYKAKENGRNTVCSVLSCS